MQIPGKLCPSFDIDWAGKSAFILSVLLIAMGSTPTAVHSQDGIPGRSGFNRYEELLERSYILNAFPRDELQLAFEAQIAPNLILLQNVDRRLYFQSNQFYGSSRESVHAFSWALTPMVRIRMFADPSFPVRTPSYMPRTTLQYFNIRRAEADDESSELARLQQPARMWIANLTLSHYSNGQEGCFFVEQERVNGICVPQAPPNPSGLTVNRVSGSFSTNFVRFQIAYKRIWTEAVENETWRSVDTSFMIGLGGEIHTTFGPGGLIDALEDRKYGTRRARIFARYEHYHRGWGRGYRWLEITGEAMNEHPDGVWPARVAVEGAWTFDGLGGLGVFGRYYAGQDYYNLAFLDNLNLFQFGLVFRAGNQTHLRFYPAENLPSANF